MTALMRLYQNVPYLLGASITPFMIGGSQHATTEDQPLEILGMNGTLRILSRHLLLEKDWLLILAKVCGLRRISILGVPFGRLWAPKLVSHP